MEYYLAIKKNEILPFATWTELEGIILNEVSQTEKDKYCMISLTCGIFFKNSQKKRSDLWLPETQGELEEVVKKYKLLVTK